MIKTPKSTPKSIPPIAAEAIDLFPCSEAPPANKRGNSPAMKAKEVIKIGLNLIFAPIIAESTIVFPFFCAEGRIQPLELHFWPIAQ